MEPIGAWRCGRQQMSGTIARQVTAATLAADKRVRVWRQPHESLDTTCPQSTVQAGECSMMQGGVGTWRDMGPLIDLDSTLTGDRYLRILSDPLHQFIVCCILTDLMNLNRTVRHPTRPNFNTEGFQKHSSEFRHFRWPPKSPDMNNIGHISDALQPAVQKRYKLPLTFTDLWTSLQDSWC
ncbi:transposable element Tcb2 transposase [Trichonephila clavipes]|nr:transposable element Tcb2 transposase [Trichonephila clavipes]